jgi:putative ABC transport system permease protein
MNQFRQIGAAIKINLGSLGQRIGASLVVVIGIAGVVGVLVTVLAMGQSLHRTMATTGRADRAIILAKGAQAEGSSSIPRDSAVTLAEIGRPGADGKPIASMEMLTQTRLMARDGKIKNVSVRGVGPQAGLLRPEVTIVQGRMFRPGLQELVIGRNLGIKFPNLEPGDRIQLQNGTWTIVGTFSSGGSAHDSEILGDADTLLAAFHRNAFQSITIALDGPDGLARLNALIASNPALAVEARREDIFFAAQSGAFTRVLTVIGLFVGVTMAIGAVFSALNTMYAAVSAQSVEIATLRAIGYNGTAVLVGVFCEALALALAGALTGIAVAWLIFNNHALSTGSVVYALHIDFSLAMLGIVWALAIGTLGGIFPAIRAARMPVAEALRAT